MPNNRLDNAINFSVTQLLSRLARCTHYGIRSWFRGMTPYTIKVIFPYCVMNSLSNFSPNLGISENTPHLN